MSIPNTKSNLAIETFTAAVAAIALKPTVHMLQSYITDIVKSIDSYVIAGGDPVDLPKSVRTCEILVKSVSALLDTHRYEFQKWDREWYMSTVGEMVTDVASITESLEEGSYGDDLCDRYNAFAVMVDRLEDEL